MGGLTSASRKKKKKEKHSFRTFFYDLFSVLCGGGINCLAKCTLNRSSEENKQNISDKTKSHSCFFFSFCFSGSVSGVFFLSLTTKLN